MTDLTHDHPETARTGTRRGERMIALGFAMSAILAEAAWLAALGYGAWQVVLQLT